MSTTVLYTKIKTDFLNLNNEPIVFSEMERLSAEKYLTFAEDLLKEKKLISTYLGQYRPFGIDENWTTNVEFKNNKLNKEGKYLEFPDSQIIFSRGDFVLFSDGTLYCGYRSQSYLLEQILKQGININECILCDFDFCYAIYKNAQNLYIDKMIEKTVEKKDIFISGLFTNNKLITHQKVCIEIKHKFATFSNGRIIISNSVSNAERNAIYDFLRNFERLLNFEFVPQSYLDEVYKKHSQTNRESTIEIASTKEQQFKITDFVNDLFKDNNKCISYADTLLQVEDRNKIAIFSDLTAVVAQGYESNPVTNRLLSYYKVIEKGKVIVVPEVFLTAIYEKAQETQKGFKDILIEKLHKLGKNISKSKNTPYNQALEKIAIHYGFPNWKKLTMISEEFSGFVLEMHKFDEKNYFKSLDN